MLNPRLDQLTDYPFDRLRALLDGLEPPAGMTPLVLSIGEPQHAPPALLTDTLAAAPAAHWGRYPPVDGTPDLKDAIAGWLDRRYGAGDAAFLPLAGTREGLFQAAALAVEAGREPQPLVLMPNPFYQVYSGAAVMWGAEPRFLDCGPETGFLPDLDALDPATLEAAAMLFLCSPANPQGAVADREYLRKAVTLARRHDVVLAVDECYGDIYSADPPPGTLQACRDLGEGYANVLVFHSLSKRSSAAGLRSGFVAGDGGLIRRFRRLRAYGGATLPLPVQAASAALWTDEAHVADNRRAYADKFVVAERVLGDRFGPVTPPGGFFLWLDVGDGEAAAKKLWAEAGLRVLPGRYLARDGADGTNPGAAYIRVALVHPPDVVEDALTRLVTVLNR